MVTISTEEYAVLLRARVEQLERQLSEVSPNPDDDPDVLADELSIVVERITPVTDEEIRAANARCERKTPRRCAKCVTAAEPWTGFTA